MVLQELLLLMFQYNLRQHNLSILLELYKSLLLQKKNTILNNKISMTLKTGQTRH